MYPIKRRRVESPSPPYSRYDYAALYDDRTDANVSVFGPALAPTAATRDPMAFASLRRRHHHPRHVYADDVQRVVSAELEYSRAYDDDWGQPTRAKVAHQPYTTAPPPSLASHLPGLSQLLYPQQRQPTFSPDRTPQLPKREPPQDRRSSGRSAFRPLSSTEIATSVPAVDTLSTGRGRRVGRSDTSSATSTPVSDHTDLRDSMESLAVDALPIHPMERRVATAVLVRTDSGSSMEPVTPPSEPPCSTPSFPAPRTLAKSSRYLREIDRRNILQRIENGEKQATLAKEYQVSRAAICNLNKHRDVVLSRKDENPLAKHPKKPRPKGVAPRIKITCKPTELVNKAAFAYEMKARSIALLLTMLRSPTTSVADFKRYADRVLRLLVEEALALVPVENVHVRLSDSVKIDGVQANAPTCAVALEASGGPHFLRVFHAIEPHQPTGSIRLRGSHVDAVDLPPSIGDHNVFVFDLFTYSGETMTTAIATLVAHGVREHTIWLVSLCVAYEVAEVVHARFPNVKIVTAQVDRSTMPVATPTTDHSGTTPPPAITKPDIPTKVLVKRFLQAYEPAKRPTTTTTTTTNTTPETELV